MLNNRKIYTKRIGISENDIKYIDTLKENKEFSKKSRNGILAEIIKHHKTKNQGKLF